MYDELSVGTPSVFGNTNDIFIYKGANGAFEGPWPIIIEQPVWGRAFLNFGREAGKLEGLPDDARETAILVAGSHWQAQFELYAHERVAVKKTGLTQEQVNAIKQGRKPDGLNEGCEIAYEVATNSITKPGPLPQELWEKAVSFLGKEGTLKLLHYTAFYAYVVSFMFDILNACIWIG